MLEPVPTLRDSDLESDDEQVIPETAPYFSWLNSFAAFCKRRPIYGMVVLSGAVFSIISLFLVRAFDAEEDWRIGSDSWSAAVLLLISATAVLAVAFVVANHEEHEPNPTNFSYEPFDEKIEIPMKVYAPKVVAVLITDQFNILGGLLIQFVLIISLVIICDLSEQSVANIMQGSRIHHTFLICTITCFNFIMLFCLIENFWKAHETTKNYLLGTFEENWQWNLKACEFLLPGIEVNSLEDLRLALLEKINDPQLTNEEKKVVDYIKRPLWKTKRAFVDTPEEEYQEENAAPRMENQSPNRAPEVQTPPRPQDPPLEPNRSPPAPQISPPMTRSRARRQQ